jgi:hypothetical protein
MNMETLAAVTSFFMTFMRAIPRCGAGLRKGVPGKQGNGGSEALLLIDNWITKP